LATAEDIINGAYRLCGIKLPSDSQKTSGLEMLNDMIGSWSNEGLLVLSLTSDSFALVVGQRSYTIGSAGNFAVAIPVQIKDSSYIRDAEGNDWPVKLYTKADYNEIVDKSTSGRPTKFVFVPGYGTGTILFNYSPDIAYTFFLESLKPFTEFSAIGDTVSLTDDYKKALKFNLAKDLSAVEYIQLSNQTLFSARESKKLIKKIKSSPIKEVDFDVAITTNKINVTNINVL